MTGFLLSDEQLVLTDAMRTYVDRAVEAGVRRRAFEGETGIDADFLKGLADLGIFGLSLPEADGGMGQSMFDAALAAEILGYAAAPGPYLGQVVALHILSACADRPTRDAWMPRLIAGEALATIGFAEAGGLYAPDRWTLDAGGGRLNGEKRDLPFATQADLLVIGVKGGFALVEQGAPGLTIEPRNDVDRTRRLSHANFADTPALFLPDRDGAAQRAFDMALMLTASDAFGGALRCLDMAVDYAKNRVQFGRPIGGFQAIRHQLADMAVDIEPSRGLHWQAARAFDEGDGDRTRIVALAKAHLGDIYTRATRMMIEIHGGIGYTWEHDAQIWFKRAMQDHAWLGTPAFHRERAAVLAGWG